MSEETSRWSRRWGALPELVVLLFAAAGVLLIGSWVADRVPSLGRAAPGGCVSPTRGSSGLLRLELAVPDEKKRDEALPTLDGLVRCAEAGVTPEAIGIGLRSSTYRDFLFIPAYTLLLLWCAARLGGFTGSVPPRDDEQGPTQKSASGSTPAPAVAGKRGFALARVDRNALGRLVGHIGAWSVLAAALLDAGENVLLLRTANYLENPTRKLNGSHLDPLPGLDRNVVSLTSGLAAAKFALLVLPIALGLVLLWQLARAIFRSRVLENAANAVKLPEVGDPERRWAVPTLEGDRLMAQATTEKDAYGICFSGGGIRSATFALGALQELEQSETDWRIGKARYLSAVSGGSYMAAAYQFLAGGGRGADAAADLKDVRKAPNAGRRALRRLAQRPGVGRWARLADRCTLPSTGRVRREPWEPATPPLLRPTGPVEDHLRRHSTHLADGAAEWALALGEVIIRMLTGLVMLLLVIWTVAVPLGWVYRYGLYGLDGDKPALSLDLRIIAVPLSAFAAFGLLRFLLAKPCDAALRLLPFGGVRTSKAREQARAAASFGLVLLLGVGIVLPFVATHVEASVSTVSRWVGITSKPHKPDADKVATHLGDLISGASATASAAAAADAADGPFPGTGALASAATATELSAREVREAVAALSRQMDRDDRDADDASEPPHLAVRFDPLTCAPLVVDGEDPVPGADTSVSIRACRAAREARATAEAVASAARAHSGGGKPAADLAAAAAGATAGANTASAAVRKLADELSSGRTTRRPQSPPLAWASLSAVFTAIGGLMAKRRMDVAKRPKAKESMSNKLAKALGFGGATEVIAGIATGFLVVVACSDVVVDSWRRGGRQELKLVTSQQPWVWWLLAASVLTLLTIFTNANSSSLRPFYHRRLWLPYAVTPDGKTAPWRTDTRLSSVGRRIPGFPELIICAAAQTSGRDWAPPGRRALPFVFTATAIGGPEVGYIRTRKLEALLGHRHRAAITLFGAVATSGAAFGPAMGRQSKGGLGAVMAIANARLGAWLPNPHHLARLTSVTAPEQLRAGSFSRWPRLWYWFMEAIGQYPTDAKLVLTTDGGHVENLGLVELLRRRCARILCFDASGAGATPTTLAEAMVMARDELGVKITLQLPPAGGDVPHAAKGEAVLSLTSDRNVKVDFSVDGPPGAAASLLAPDDFAADPLRRRSSMIEELAARIAGHPVLVARITYPCVGDETVEPTGWLVYGTLALANDGPDEWDLLEYAQRHDIFPNDGTVRQWFDASTFSAYQQLGRLTARRMMATTIPPDQAPRQP